MGTGSVRTENVESRIQEMVAVRGGLYFKDHDLKNLKSAVQERMQSRKTDSVPAYYEILTDPEKQEEEFRELLNLLTIHHTYFFRNEAQFKVLKEKTLPELIERRRSSRKEGPLRIWSAGCSTGEEPYSIAMTVLDLLGEDRGIECEVWATDISTNAIDQARRGVYGLSAMRLVDPDHRERYFNAVPGAERNAQYHVKELVKKIVRFDRFNLMEDQFPFGFDVIFCRNVVIYFDAETIKRVVERFAVSLADDGTLFMGYSESLQFVTDRFQMGDYEDAVFYRKAAPKKPARPIPLKPAETPRPVRYEEPPTVEQVVRSIHLKEYSKALSAVDQLIRMKAETAELHCLAAEVHSNLRKFEEARRHIEKALAIDGFSAPAYYLLGTIEMEAGNSEKAREYLKKALYLDRSFILASFGLAMSYRQDGKADEAIRSYRNTLKDLARQGGECVLKYGGGFNAATLAGVCRDNLERVKAEQWN